MNFTDEGTYVIPQWMPLAMANGIEWMSHRKPYADRFDNLYRNRLSLNAVLWYVGAVVQFFFDVSSKVLRYKGVQKGQTE